MGRVQFRATSIVDGCAHVSLSPLTFGAARYGEVPVAKPLLSVPPSLPTQFTGDPFGNNA